jgi:ABC-type lipoprotein release transport system permease subunit
MAPMKRSRFLLRNLTYYRRTNIPVILGVAIAVAVLSGALMVGQSVRASLRHLLFERIGAAEYLIAAENFFREDLSLAFEPELASCPIIHLKGVVVHETTGIQSHNANIYGIDERFWKFHGMPPRAFADDRSAFIGGSLARQLDAKIEDGLLIRVETQQTIPREWLYGRRDTVGRTLRFTCKELLPDEDLGEFALRPSQGNVHSVFVPMRYLQKALSQPSKANAILLTPRNTDSAVASITDILAQNLTLQDLGLQLRTLPAGDGFSLESNRIVLDERTERAAMQAASQAGMETSPLYTYLANSIRAGSREIPYSVITAADLGKGALKSIEEVAPSLPDADPNESIWLTDWAARDLGIRPGETVALDYFLWRDEGKLETRTTQFRVAGIVAISGSVDQTLAPSIPGVTDSRSIHSWDPPFPLDLGRIRPQDEDYWERHKGTPKAFISLAKGQNIWQSRFGKLTALRLVLPHGMDLQTAEAKFTDALRRNLDPASAGIAAVAIKQQGLEASHGTTDFGEYFVYFSFFLIVSAILLAALFFKLLIEQRVREIGILRAAGFSERLLLRSLFFEGAILSTTGSLLGILASIGYGWLMVFGLRTWWTDAVGTQRITFSISWQEIGMGAACGIFISLCSLAWTLRTLRQSSPRMLLTGALESYSAQKRQMRGLLIVSAAAGAAALFLLTGSALGKVSQLQGFFGAGFCLLLSILCATALFLRRSHPSTIRGSGWSSLLHLGLRNAMHRPGRSLFCASLIAAATFIVVSTEVFRQDVHSISLDRNSGTGGYGLLAESALPILQDLNSPAGQDSLGVSSSQYPVFGQVRFVSFRERPGDDASCLNLYAPKEPTILGAPESFRAEGRFSFQSSLAETSAHKSNPWLLLDSFEGQPFIPAIVDAGTLQYILHQSLGSELVLQKDGLQPVRLRFVAALRDSIFQGKLIISEANFLRLFPEQEGFRFFLLDTHQTQLAPLIPQLREALSDYGFAVESSQERLAGYHRVENTYLSTFQSLGTLGLVLGTIGLATVLLRNVLERRQELALLRAVGYRMRVIAVIILAENIFLMFWGLASGTICALLAILPAINARGASVSLTMTAVILIAVLIAGLLSSVFAVIAALRTPLLPALRAE